MTRRSDHSRKEIEQMAIAAGQKIIKTIGYRELSARKIAAEIGYTVGTLYNVFSDYYEMTLHINLITLKDLKNHLIKSIKQDVTGIAAIKAMAHTYIEFAYSDKFRWSALFEYNIKPEYGRPDWYNNEVYEIFSIVEQHLLPLFNENKHIAEISARTIWCSIHGLCILNISRKLDMSSKESLGNIIDTFIEDYLSGVTKRIITI